MKVRFSIGDLVVCVMHDGFWVVSNVWHYRQSKDISFVRYEIRQGEEFQNDIPQVWLTRARVKRPVFQLVAGLDTLQPNILTPLPQPARSRL